MALISEAAKVFESIEGGASIHVMHVPFLTGRTVVSTPVEAVSTADVHSGRSMNGVLLRCRDSAQKLAQQRGLVRNRHRHLLLARSDSIVAQLQIDQSAVCAGIDS